MSSCMSIFDLTDSIVGLTYNGKRHYKSVTGGILSIIMFIGIITIIVLNSIPYFSKKGVQVWIENKRHSTPPILNISSNFYFAIMTQFNTTQPESPDQRIQIEAIYHNSASGQVSREKLNKFPCNQIGEPTLEELFDQMRLTNGLCFNISNVFIGGSSINEVFKYVEIEMKLCSTKDITNCLSNELNDKEIEQSVQLFFIDTVFQMKDQNKPINHYLNYIDVNFTLHNHQETNVYFSQNEINVENIFYTFSNPTVYSIYNLDYYQTRQSYIANDPMSISFNLLASYRNEIIHVSYTKFIDMVVTVTSLSHLVKVLFTLIGQNLNHSQYQNELIHSLFRINKIKKKTIRQLNYSPRKPPIHPVMSLDQFSLDQSNLPIILASPKKKKSKTQTKVHFKPDAISTNQPSNKPNLTLKKQMTLHQNKLNVQREEFHFTLTTLILIGLSNLVPCLCCKGVQRNKISFLMLNNLISIYQEVKNVYRKLQEIDLMKYLLFSEEQLASYQLIPQPECLLNTNLLPIPLYPNDFLAKIIQKSYHFMKSPTDVNRMNENIQYQEIKQNAINNNGMNLSFNDRIKKLINESNSLEQ